MGFVNPILYTRDTERVNNLPKVTQLNQFLNQSSRSFHDLHDRASQAAMFVPTLAASQDCWDGLLSSRKSWFCDWILVSSGGC